MESNQMFVAKTIDRSLKATGQLSLAINLLLLGKKYLYCPFKSELKIGD
jgi:hypothetical protein